jgi:hypothetical protein
MVLRKSTICASGLFVLFISAQVISAHLGRVANENQSTADGYGSGGAKTSSLF